MASEPSQIASKGICLAIVGLDPAGVETAQQVAAAEGIQRFTASADYVPGNSVTSFERQHDGSDAMVCLVDFDKDKELAAQFAVVIQALYSSRAILVAVSADEDPELILMAMRSGCNEYLRKPLRADELASCLQKLSARYRATSQGLGSGGGRIVGFLGVRGGAGATTIAVHLGTALAQLQCRKTLIIDRYPQLGHVAILLNCEANGYDFPEMVSNIDRLDLALLHSYVARHDSGLHVLRSPDSLNQTVTIGTEALERAIRFVSKAYEFILLDCPQGMDDLNDAVVRCCDEFHLVATPELPAVRDLSRYLSRMAELGVPPGKLKVVLNQQDPHRTVTAKQIEEAIAHPVDIVLPFCPADLIPATDTGEPVPAGKKSPFTSEIRKWAGSLAPVPGAAPQIRKRFSFWSQR